MTTQAAPTAPTASTKPAKAKKDSSPKAKQSPKSSSPKGSDSKAARKAQMEKNAAEIRRLEAESKKKPAVKDGGTLMVLPKLVECKDPIFEIQARRVKVSAEGNALTLDKDTTPGEFVRILDGLSKSEENIQFLIGDMMNEGEKLADKWEGVGRGKYEPFLVSTGRKIDALKHYRMVAKAIPKSDRLLPYTHCRELVKVPELEDRRKIITEAVELQKKENRKVTSREIKAKADKVTPPKKSKAGKSTPPEKVKVPDALREVLVMTVEQNDTYGQILEKAKELDGLIQGAAFILEISGEQKMPLRESLEHVARFAAQLQ